MPPESIKWGTYYKAGRCFVTNEGTKKSPKFVVWEPTGIHRTGSDSCYSYLDLAIARCDFLHRERTKYGLRWHEGWDEYNRKVKQQQQIESLYLKNQKQQ